MRNCNLKRSTHWSEASPRPTSLSQGAFFWGYSSYSYSGLGITEYTEFQFRKERSEIWNTHRGGDLGTTMSVWRDR